MTSRRCTKRANAAAIRGPRLAQRRIWDIYGFLALPGYWDHLSQRDISGSCVNLVTAGLLGVIESGVGGGEQIGQFRARVAERGHADGDGEPDPVSRSGVIVNGDRHRGDVDAQTFGDA